MAAAIICNIHAGKELASFQNPGWLPHVRSGCPAEWRWWRIFKVPDRRTPLGAVCCDTHILSSCSLTRTLAANVFSAVRKIARLLLSRLKPDEYR